MKSSAVSLVFLVQMRESAIATVRSSHLDPGRGEGGGCELYLPESPPRLRGGRGARVLGDGQALVLRTGAAAEAALLGLLLRRLVDAAVRFEEAVGAEVVVAEELVREGALEGVARGHLEGFHLVETVDGDRAVPHDREVGGPLEERAADLRVVARQVVEVAADPGENRLGLGVDVRLGVRGRGPLVLDDQLGVKVEVRALRDHVAGVDLGLVEGR